MWFFYKFLAFFVRKRPKYPSKWEISSQICKDFPPKAQFPGNEIHKFHIFEHAWWGPGEQCFPFYIGGKGWLVGINGTME